MRAFNLEIFSPSFDLKDHATVSDVDYIEDYLTPEETLIEAPSGMDVAVGDYVRLTDTICGVVSNLDRNHSWETLIYFLPFTSLFSFDVMFDTDWQGQGTLEGRIAQIITDTLIENADAVQNVAGLSISTTSATTGWGFNLKALTEGTHRLIVNLQETVLRRALTEYGVAVHVATDFQNRTITATVGTAPGAMRVIESDLPNVISKSVSIDVREYAINKLVLYDTETLERSMTYYLHPDGTYDTTDADRIAPVAFEIEAVYSEAGEDDGGDESFEKAAASRAREVFGYEKINNLIEIEVQAGDPLVDVTGTRIGQEVAVLSDGRRFTSIVTGRRVGTTETLIMGAVRLDLTKMMGGTANG